MRGWAVSVCVLCACGRVDFMPRADGSTGTFGVTQFGSQRGMQTPDSMRAARFELTANAYVTSVSLSIVGDMTANTQPMVAVIYSDASGQPDALLARSNEVIVSGTTPLQWIDIALPAPVHLTPGFYWIGDHTGGSQCTFFTFESVVGAGRRPMDVYADGTDPVAASGTPSDREYAFYATYLTAP